MERVVQQAAERLDRGAADWKDVPALAVGEAAQCLRLHGAELVQAFVRQLREELIAQPSDFLKLDTTPSTSPDLLPLRLMDEAQADEDIEIMRGAQLMEGEAEWDLRELQARTSTLKGDDTGDRDSNPLRPQALLRAWGQALKNVELGAGARLALLRAVAVPMAAALRQAAKDCVNWLDAQGVQAAGYRIVAAPLPRGGAAPSYDVTRPGALHELLQSAPAGNAPASTGFASASDPVALESTLDGVLQRLHAAAAGSANAVNLVRRYAQRLSALASQDSERRVIAVMAQLFDHVFADPCLPASAKALIGRLQGAALRVALSDPDLFNRHDHPTWALINTLGSHTMGYTQGDVRLQDFLARVAPVFDIMAASRAPGAELHEQALARVRQIVDESLVREQQTAAEALRRLEARESRLIMQQLFQEQVAHKLAGLALDEPLRSFLTQDWVQVLIESSWPGYAGPVSADTYWETFKALAASLQPSADPASRQALLVQVPALIASLRQGMALVDLPPTRQQAVLDALMDAHQRLIKAARGGTVPAAASELSAEDIVRRMREESPAGPQEARAAAPGDSLLDVNTLDTVPAGLEPHEGGSTDWTNRLAPGVWLRVFNRGDWAAMRLLWRSRSGHYLLLATPLADHPLSMTQRALERLAREQLARPLETRSLFERAVDAMMGAA
jgi:hypothetical protein